MEKSSHDLLKMGIEGQLKKVEFPRLSALALYALLTFLKPVLNAELPPHYRFHIAPPHLSPQRGHPASSMDGAPRQRRGEGKENKIVFLAS